ncbi:MAG: alpha-amylase family glycosyl hydrolase [Acidimicrobiia bacterium]|jgi:amylosucrase
MDWITHETPTVLSRLLPRVESVFDGHPRRLRHFADRLEHGFEDLFRLMHSLYGWRYDFHFHLEEAVLAAARAAAERPAWLRRRDATGHPRAWMDDHRTLWAMAYTERFAGDLGGVRRHIDHLGKLGVTHLHLMPLYAVPEGPNDGGYAVSDYRTVRPDLGTSDDLRSLARSLDEAGISLVLDFVANHTADDHPWAEAAKAGDERHRRFYLVYDDRDEPDRFASHLREIFPDRGGDAFTWRTDVAGPAGGAWVWTTFYPFQWDLDYRNPEVLTAALGELLYLANLGATVIRMDATPFLWKEEGTSCENLPQAHVVLQIVRVLAEMAAPSVTFLSEAIVHPDDVASYVRVDECPVGYNPLVMSTCWEALATRDTRLLRHALAHRMALPSGTQWLTYLRCHDDIGWGFADEDALVLGIDPVGHRRFLNDFYDGSFPGSFSIGFRFQDNPRTGDARMSGTLASLAGLERASIDDDGPAVDAAVARILALHTVMLTVGGLPLIYLGDEIAQLNDHGYRADPLHEHDNRWVHRPFYDWGRLAESENGIGAHGRVWHGIRRLLGLRRRHPALVTTDPVVLQVSAPEILAYEKRAGDDRALVAVNFSERSVEIMPGELPPGRWGVDGHPALERVTLHPYETVIWTEGRGQNSEG